MYLRRGSHNTSLETSRGQHEIARLIELAVAFDIVLEFHWLQGVLPISISESLR